MERIRALRIPSQEGEISLTVSIGLEGLPTRGAVLEELLNRADQALYQAKYQGRDRICLGQTLSTFRTTSDIA